MRSADLASLTVLDELGVEVTLGTLWREHSAVLAFIRQFG